MIDQLNNKKQDKNRLFFRDWHKYIRSTFGTEQWVIVYAHYRNSNGKKAYYSALIPKDAKERVLGESDWDLLLGWGRPGRIYYGKTNEEKYFRFGDDNGIEPFVIYRSFPGTGMKSYPEISEEFRYYFNLYHDTKSNKYIAFDEDGEPEEVISIDEDEVKIKLKYIKEFLAIKNMYLVVFFEHDRDSIYSLKELGLNKISKIIKGDKFIYNYYTTNLEFIQEGEKTKAFARVMGKKLIEGLKNYQPPSILLGTEKKKYISFIINTDNEGKEVEYSCNPKKLSNYFGANPGAPHYLTPVFFKKEVLGKYYADPNRFSVEDGYLRGRGLRMDNNHKKYVIVFLGDIGYLSQKEQLYWKSYNIPPDGTMSKVAFKRGFLAQFADPQKEDLVFKYKFKNFNNKWFKKFGWYLFKPFLKQDEHFYISLRIPLSENQSEFDQQILSLTKLLIDSLNEEEISKSITKEKDQGGITKLEKYLQANKVPSGDNRIIFLRGLQDLRDGVGHRKGKKYLRGASYFKLNERNFSEIYKEILNQAIELLDFLEKHFL
jgi:hypothetical protein